MSAIGVVGAGRVGVVLAAALQRAGHDIVAVATTNHRARARRLLGRVPIRSPHEVAHAADVLFLTVPDDAIAAVAADLAQPGQLVVHTSGAHGLGVLAGAENPLAIHPAMTFTGAARDLARLAAGITFGVTAPARLKARATRLVADLGGVPEWVAEEARPLYHAALTHGANHLVTLVNEAMDELRAAGVRQPARLLRPLLTAALDNVLDLGDAALTGPVSRGDAGTLATHLRALPPESVPAYLALARRTADRALASGRLKPADAGALLDVLATGRAVVPA